jgi:hypothetical protein
MDDTPRTTTAMEDDIRTLSGRHGDGPGDGSRVFASLRSPTAATERCSTGVISGEAPHIGAESQHASRCRGPRSRSGSLRPLSVLLSSAGSGPGSVRRPAAPGPRTSRPHGIRRVGRDAFAPRTEPSADGVCTAMTTSTRSAMGRLTQRVQAATYPRVERGAAPHCSALAAVQDGAPSRLRRIPRTNRPLVGSPPRRM